MRKAWIVLLLAVPSMLEAQDVKKIIPGPEGRLQYYPRFSSVTLGDLGGGPKIADEGAVLGGATWFNFVGGGVSASVSGATATVTIPGGGGAIGYRSIMSTNLVTNTDGLDTPHASIISTNTVQRGATVYVEFINARSSASFDVGVSSFFKSSNTYTVNISSIGNRLIFQKETGNVATPELTIGGGTLRSGLYGGGGDTWNMGANATQVANIGSSLFTFSVPLSWNSGSITSPGMRNGTCVTCGFYQEGGPSLAIGMAATGESMKWWTPSGRVSVGRWGGSNSFGGGFASIPGAGFYVSTTGATNEPLMVVATGTTSNPQIRFQVTGSTVWVGAPLVVSSGVSAQGSTFTAIQLTGPSLQNLSSLATDGNGNIIAGSGGGGGGGGGGGFLFTGNSNISVSTFSFPGATLTSDGQGGSSVTFIPAILSTFTALQSTGVYLSILWDSVASTKTAFYNFTSTSDAQQTKFVNFRSTSDVLFDTVISSIMALGGVGKSTATIFSALNSTAVTASNFYDSANSTMSALTISTTSLSNLLQVRTQIYADEGGVPGSDVTLVNCVGAGISCSQGGSTVTISVSGGGGGGSSDNLGSHIATNTIVAPFGLVVSSTLYANIPASVFIGTTNLINQSLLIVSTGPLSNRVDVLDVRGSSTHFSNNTVFFSSPIVAISSMILQAPQGRLGGSTILIDSMNVVMTTGSFSIGGSTRVGSAIFTIGTNPKNITDAEVLHIGTRSINSPGQGTWIGVAALGNSVADLINYSQGTIVNFRVDSNGIITGSHNFSTQIGDGGHTVFGVNLDLSFGSNHTTANGYSSAELRAGGNINPRADSRLLFNIGNKRYGVITTSGAVFGQTNSGARSSFDVNSATSSARWLSSFQSSQPINANTERLMVFLDSTSNIMSAVTSSGGFVVGGSTSYFNSALTVNTLTNPSGLTASTYTAVFSSGTSASNFYQVALTSSGHVSYSGPVPTLSGCGTGPTLQRGSNDSRMVITVGATGTGCTVTFGQSWKNPPTCHVIQRTMSLVNALTVNAPTTTGMSFSQTGAASGVYDVWCDGLNE